MNAPLQPQTSGFKRGGYLTNTAREIEVFFLRYRTIVSLVHVGMFVLFVGLLAVPLFLETPPEDASALNNFTNFANMLIWGVWFPLVFVSVIVTGRSWCGLLCPMGAASEWANKIGFKRAIPKWVQWPGTPVVTFVFVTIWAQTVGARDHAAAMAIVFGTTMLAAILLGLFFGRDKRAWCRHMCPIGLALGVYSRMGAVDFRPKRPKEGERLWTEKTACPTMIDLPRKIESRHCIECFKCVQPRAKGGLYMRLRKPGEEIATIRRHNANLSEIMFLFLGTGTAIGGFLWLVLNSYQSLRHSIGNFVIEKEWYWLAEPGPIWLMSNYPAEREVFRWLDFFLISGYMLSWAAGIALVLSIVTGVSAWISGKLGGTGTDRQRFVELGYQFLPIAMISLLLGLGSGLFETLATLGLNDAAVSGVKGAGFVGGALWSAWLGARLLQQQGVARNKLWMAMWPGLIGTAAVGAAWAPALFS